MVFDQVPFLKFKRWVKANDVFSKDIKFYNATFYFLDIKSMMRTDGAFLNGNTGT